MVVTISSLGEDKMASPLLCSQWSCKIRAEPGEPKGPNPVCSSIMALVGGFLQCRVVRIWERFSQVIEAKRGVYYMEILVIGLVWLSGLIAPEMVEVDPFFFFLFFG